MRLKLLYKSYDGRGITAKQGEVVTVQQDIGESLMRDFPEWWERVDAGRDEKQTKDVKQEQTGDQTKAVQK
jgi:hypothetical protein